MNSLRKEENIFNILDVPVDIQADKLRKKCQDLLLKFHPDKNGGIETEDYHKVKLKKIVLETRLTHISVNIINNSLIQVLLLK